MDILHHRTRLLRSGSSAFLPWLQEHHREKHHNGKSAVIGTQSQAFVQEQTAYAHRFVGYRWRGENVVHLHGRSLLCKIYHEQRSNVCSLHDGNRPGRTYRILACALVHQEVWQKEHVHLVARGRRRGNARGVYRWYCGG